MDYFERRIGISATDVIADLMSVLDDVHMYTVVVDGGQASVKLNVRGCKELSRLIHVLGNELAAVDCADELLAKIRNRNLSEVKP